MHRATRSIAARILIFAAASGAALSLAAAAAAAGPNAAAPASHGLDVAGIDRTVAPGDDFFRYANGAWLKATEIPADRSGCGTGAEVAELTAKRVADLIRDAAAKSAPRLRTRARSVTTTRPIWMRRPSRSRVSRRSNRR